MATFGPKAWSHPFGKMSIFMGIKPWFWSKNGPFSNFQAIQHRKMSLTIFQNEKTPFEAIKTRSSKVEKLKFFHGMVHGIGPKNGHFSNFFIQIISTRKMSFTIFQNQKTSFQAIKTRSSKSRKIDIFPKGLTNGFGPKMAIFPTFLFRQFRS